MIKKKTTVNRSRASRFADVRTRPTGSITQFFLETDAAREWVRENVETEGWMWLGNALNVDARMANTLIDGMLDAGLEVF